MTDQTHIVIKYQGKEYAIYKKSGVIYDTTSAQDIPPMIFRLRDTYIKRSK